MQQTTKGWLVFLAALGMTFSLIAVEIGTLVAWGDASAPSFVAKIIAHVGTVIGAFVGGKLIPTEKE